MKFEDIIAINKSIRKLKELNIEFDFEIADSLIENLMISDKIIDEQNVKLSELVIEFGKFDGYEYVISKDDMENYKAKCQELYDQEFNNVPFEDIKNLICKTKLNLTTMELIIPILKINN